LLAGIPGQPFVAPRAVYDAVASEIDAELRWLRDFLGYDVFPERPPDHDVPPAWSKQTMAALAGQLNALVLAAERRDVERGTLWTWLRGQLSTSRQ